jgi:WD40 repeat protein
MLLTQYKGHISCIWSLDFNESGYFFLSGSSDKTIKLWKTDGPLPIRIFIGHKGDVYKIKFLKNPDYIISSSSDKTVRIWTLQKAECIRVIFFLIKILNF